MKPGILLFNFLLISTVLSAQLKIPKTPAYDSLYVREYNGRILEKYFFKNKVRVFEIDYATDYGRLDFSLDGARKEDSCYILVQNGRYDFYFFAATYITHENLSDVSKIYYYTKYSRPGNEKIEEGRYLRVKDHYYNVVQGTKYKIGKWLKYDSGKIVEEIDYDNYTINKKGIYFTDPKKIILNSFKLKTDSLIKATFGESFSKKYIKFNSNKSTFNTYLKEMYPEQPSGNHFGDEAFKTVEFADFCYDIVLNDTLRFDAIMIRIDSAYNIIGKTHFDNYYAKEFYFCVGLDKTLSKNMNISSIDFKGIAKRNHFNYWSKDFDLRMEWIPEQGLFGKLYFVMEEKLKKDNKTDDRYGLYTQLRIDPLTGKEEIMNKDYGYPVMDH